MYANMTLNEIDTKRQATSYQGNIDAISGTIAKYDEKINKLNAVKVWMFHIQIRIKEYRRQSQRYSRRGKFEIAAYPSSKYGYFTGIVENIAKDISVDPSTGYAYYLVKVKCDHMLVKNEKGEEASLINGMACQAKIIVDEENVLTYLLEKIDLFD